MRRPTARLALTLLALVTLIAGYYLGQYWQRRPLQDLSATVFANGRPLALPEAHFPVGRDVWRLFVTGDTTAKACSDLLRDYGFARNRLAAVPDIQARLRLVVIAFDEPGDSARERLAGGADWIDVIAPAVDERDRLARALEILPAGPPGCTGNEANAVLVSPRHEAWARIPREQPPAMARNIRGVIEFVE